MLRLLTGEAESDQNKQRKTALFYGVHLERGGHVGGPGHDDHQHTVSHRGDLKNIAQLFYNNLVGGAVGYNGEVDEVVPEASLC